MHIFALYDHLRHIFDDNTRMIRLVTTLDKEAKRTVDAIGCNKIFYATKFKRSPARLQKAINCFVIEILVLYLINCK